MNDNQSGNVFFYILLCIILLAALSYAVATGGRSSVQSLTEDQRHLVATEIISFADTTAKAVSQLRLRGTAETALSFANDFLSAADYGTYNAAPANEIFNPGGGAVVYHDPPAEASTTGTATYQFLSANAVHNVGTTCTLPECADLVMIIPNVKLEVCLKLNDLLGVANPADAPPVDGDIDESATFKPGVAPFTYAETIGDEDGALEGQAEACLNETSENPDEYVYYKVLIPR